MKNPFRNLRSALLPSALVLLLAGSLAVAQTFTRAIQLSQDTSGAFSVDTNNGVYFPSHILSTGTNQTPPSITGTGTPTVAGTDFAATITMGAAATTATVLFGRAYVTAPTCILGWQAVLAAETYTLSTTGITITQTGATADKIGYFCTSVS